MDEGVLGAEERRGRIVGLRPKPITLDDLRRYAVARAFSAPTTLKRALQDVGFVQADPIRAPARAQDLTLRHRVKGYRAGDLERRYAKLDIEEDYFVIYGFVTKSLQALMHPRSKWYHPWSPKRRKQAAALLEFVRDRGIVHPREVEAHFSHGKVTNYWGGSSNATTHLLESMQYRGLLRVAKRVGGVRVYAPHEHGPEADGPAERRARLDDIVDAAAHIYAPLPASRLSHLVVTRLRHAVPQWHGDLRRALERAKQRLAHARVDGVEWYWPAGENPTRAAMPESVRLLAPFDPVVWDRDRFERFWGWQYRFEAYTPAAKRKLGYYALPLLWRDRVIGWGNVSAKNGKLVAEIGYVGSAPRERAFRNELDEDLDRMRGFLGLELPQVGAPRDSFSPS
jgi:uncharacterized protein YcaQ